MLQSLIVTPTSSHEDSHLTSVSVCRVAAIKQDADKMSSRSRTGMPTDDLTSCRDSLATLGLTDTAAFVALESQLEAEERQGLADEDEDMLATTHSVGGIGG